MTTLPQSAQNHLRQFIEQIERLEEEKKAIADDIKEKFLEAKAVGFDVKVMRQVLRLRKKSLTERQEEESVLDVYLHALGMLDTPMGAADTVSASSAHAADDDEDPDTTMIAAE
jgi:uncharacterized protein (UPF0335 family)